MKIEKRSKGVRLTLTKTELGALAHLLEYAGREKQERPVYWLMKPKADRKLFDSLCGLVKGGSWSRVYSAPDDTELSEEHRTAQRAARGVL